MKTNPFPSTRNLPQIESLEDRLVLDASGYVASLYTNVLQRPGSQMEVAFWVNYMAQGHSVTEIAEGFTRSPENLGNQVKQEYLSILHRNADAAGLSNGIYSLSKNGSLRDLDSGLLNSPEYLKVHPTIASQVKGLYNDVLNRAPDPAGEAAWVSLLSNTANRPQVVKGFLNSPEHINLTVTKLFQKFLHRSPTVQELLTDDALLSSDEHKYESLAVSLLTSTEYETPFGVS